MRRSGTGKLFVVSAPSGAGKNTVVKGAMKRLSSVRRSISWTTRKPRKGEREGIDYNFVSEAKFKNLVSRKGFIEWAEVFGEHYGTPFSNIRKAKRDRLDLFLIIDVQGGLQIKRRVKDSVLIFIVTPGLKDLKKRLKRRGKESEAEIRNRLKKARWEISRAKSYDYKIVNDKLSSTVKKMVEIVRKARTNSA